MKKLTLLSVILLTLIISGCLTPDVITNEYEFASVERPPDFIGPNNATQAAIIMVGQDKYIKILLQWISSVLKTVDKEEYIDETEWIDEYLDYSD